MKLKWVKKCDQARVRRKQLVSWANGPTKSALYSQPYNLLFQCKSNISTVKLKWVKKCDQSRVRRTTTSTK